jgi:hypothetical protein
MYQVFFFVDDIADVVDLPKYDEYMMIMRLIFQSSQLHVLHQKVFSFNSLRKEVSLHVSVVTMMKNMRKVLNQVKELCHCVLLLSNC